MGMSHCTVEHNHLGSTFKSGLQVPRTGFRWVYFFHGDKKKNWDSLELAFFAIGRCYKTGTSFGALGGLQLILKETQSMMWSKPRNVQMPHTWQSKQCYGVTLRDLWIYFMVHLSHHWGNARCRRGSKHHGCWNWDRKAIQQHRWGVWGSTKWSLLSLLPISTGSTQGAPQPDTEGPGRDQTAETQLKAAPTGWGSTMATSYLRHIWKNFPMAISEKQGPLVCAASGQNLSTSRQICRSRDAQHPGAEWDFICKCSSGVQERVVLAQVTHSTALKTAAVPQKCAAANTDADGIDWLQQSLRGAALLVGFYETDQEFMAAYYRSRVPQWAAASGSSSAGPGAGREGCLFCSSHSHHKRICACHCEVSMRGRWDL